MQHFNEFKNENILNEGLISYATDLVMAFRIVKILYQDWDKTAAYKLGIIDASGNKIKQAENIDEKSAYSPFIRLVFKIKKLLNAIPGGDTKIGSLAAAYALLKENENIDICDLTKEDLDSLFEDTPVNVSSGSATIEKPLGKIQRRAKELNIDNEEYQKIRSAKLRLEDWRKVVTDESLKKHIEESGYESIIVKTDNEGPLFLKGKKPAV